MNAMKGQLRGDGMASTSADQFLREFAQITRLKEPLAPFTQLRIGGPAEVLIRPRSFDELAAVQKRALDAGSAFRVLGAGGNLLVNDEGVDGVVVLLDAPAFGELQVRGRVVHAGCGARLAGLIACAAEHNLAGLEPLVGLPGSVGGALRLNAGDRTSDIGQFVQRVEVLDSQAARQSRNHDDMRLNSSYNHLDDVVLLTAEFELEPDQPEAIVKRLRKAWIQRKANQPFSYQAAGQLFKDPAGLNAAGLIEQAHLAGTRVGGAQISDRNANYIVAEPGTKARDVLRLIDLVRTKVDERFHVELELAMSVW
jgi:UDP-N-acetylmuramate dehydrogenase